MRSTGWPSSASKSTGRSSRANNPNSRVEIAASCRAGWRCRCRPPVEPELLALHQRCRRSHARSDRVSCGRARGELLQRLLLAVDLERRNDRVRRDEIGEWHRWNRREADAAAAGRKAADHREGPYAVNGRRRCRRGRIDPTEMAVGTPIDEVDAGHAPAWRKTTTGAPVMSSSITASLTDKLLQHGRRFGDDHRVEPVTSVFAVLLGRGDDVARRLDVAARRRAASERCGP